MLQEKLWTGNCVQDYVFKLRGETYRVHSVVRLTEKGQRYLGSTTKDVILLEQCRDKVTGRLWWKYQYQKYCWDRPPILTEVVTDQAPYKLVEKVVLEASYEYASREIFGVNSPEYTKGNKKIKQDWEIPEVVIGWIVLALVFLVAAIFKDWYVKAIIRVGAVIYFNIYRKAYIDANTVYIHPEDTKMLKKKYEICYGAKFDNEDEDK